MTVRGGLVLVAITVLLLVPESLLRSGLPAWLSDVWFRVHYPAASTLWQSLGSAVPQLGLVVLVLATLVLVVPPAAVWFVTRRFLPGLLTLAMCGALISAWFNLNWGFNYARQPVAHALGMTGEPTDPDVLAFYRYLASVLEAEKAAPADTDGAVSAATEELNRLLVELDYFTTVTAPVRTLPPGVFMAFGVAGSIQPLSLTAHVDGGLTAFELVVTSVHELAHVAGEASEAGATLLAALAGLRSDHPYARYSAALHSIASLGELEPGLLPERARADLQAARERSAELNSPALLALQRSLFGAYLDWQGGGDGGLDYATGTAQLVLAWRAGLLD
mgnify:CR=1 FL=1